MLKKSDKPKPDCLALLICEGVVEDSRSKNKTILNTYNRIFSARYPARHDRLAIFLSLTDGHGDHAMTVQIVRAEAGLGQEPLVKMEGNLHFPDPLAVTEFTFDLRGLVIPAAGKYVIEVRIDGEIVKQRRFEAVLHKNGGKKS